MIQVVDVLRKGHIFLNTSLTEAYCMAIVEAASCGLKVVSTRVGGIPEVLPSHLIYLTDATVDSLYKGVIHVIGNILNEREQLKQNGTIIKNLAKNGIEKLAFPSTQPLNDDDQILCPYECNEILRKLYNWNNITTRTERVYQRVLKEKGPSFGDKLSCYLKTCIPYVLVVSFSYLLLKIFDIIQPRDYIDIAVETKSKPNRSNKENV